MMNLSYKVKEKSISLNDFLNQKQFNDAYIFNLIKNQNVRVNGVVVSRYHQLQRFDEVQVTLNEEENTLYSYDFPLKILYEDEYLLIVFKEKGEEVEPSLHHFQNSLANKVTAYYQKKGISSKIHLVNRLDKMTCGIVILAKNRYIKHLFSTVKIQKKYLAHVEGKVSKKGMIKIKIKKEEQQVKRIISEDGKLSISKYKRLDYDYQNSLVEVHILTGRTHQIRLSFAFLNHPLIGDMLYNPHSTSYELFDLKAYKIKFKHPLTHKTINISC